MESYDHQRLVLVAFSSLLLCISAETEEQVNLLSSISDPPSAYIDFASGLDSSIAEAPSEALPPFNSDPLLESISPSAEIDPSVKEICNSTDYPSLCLNTVTPFLHGKIDVLSVLEVAMKAANMLAKFVSGVVKKLADVPQTPPKIANILDDCRESFDSVLDNFDSALDAFKDRDTGTMNTMLSAVITDVGDCEDQFAESGSPSPVSSYSDKLTNMTSNCLAIISLIH